MSATCVLFLDDLRREDECPLSLEVDPAILELSEKDEAKPVHPIVLKGTASLLGEFISLRLKVQCTFILPCALCNEPFEYELQATIDHQEPVSDIRHRQWNFTEVVREAILVELPFFPQCGGSDCKNRQQIQKYLVKQ